MQKCRERDRVQTAKTAVIVVSSFGLCALPKFRHLVVEQSLLLLLLVIVSGSIFATIPCTKIVGFCLSLICFVLLFTLSIYQEDFCFWDRNCPDLAVSIAILLTFIIGLTLYTITIVCFCNSREFKR